MGIELSICIPTFNRADYLPETLDSIIAQLPQQAVEIVISDNASTDNTKELVQQFKQKFSNITYHRNVRNIGADLNYLEVVKHAKGEYCWFFGSDDVAQPGALERLLLEIRAGHDIFLCNRVDCTVNMEEIVDRYWLQASVGDRVFQLDVREDFLDYMSNANSLGALFSFLSSIIFKRSKWNRVSYRDVFTGSAYAHVFMLFSFIPQGCSLKYIKQQLVLSRTGNDSFHDGSVLKRFLLDIDGYSTLANNLFEDEELKRAFMRVMAREHRPKDLLRLRSIASGREWAAIHGKLETFKFGRVYLSFLKYILNDFSTPLLRKGIDLYRAVR